MEFPRVLHKGRPETVEDGQGGHKLNRKVLKVNDEAEYAEAKAKGWKDDPVAWPVIAPADAEDDFDDAPADGKDDDANKRPIPEKGKKGKKDE